MEFRSVAYIDFVLEEAAEEAAERQKQEGGALSAMIYNPDPELKFEIPDNDEDIMKEVMIFAKRVLPYLYPITGCFSNGSRPVEFFMNIISYYLKDDEHSQFCRCIIENGPYKYFIEFSQYPLIRQHFLFHERRDGRFFRRVHEDMIDLAWISSSTRRLQQFLLLNILLIIDLFEKKQMFTVAVHAMLRTSH
ncbi:unnamed protein product [Caenorhabditis auriculariae]|uniref:Uncharacterized protein n=1 Tax=Caenorhabditis auriculariae TaxID=2777116 RepID=A0A8S1HAH3_9PELO|nr:unnamed protein product [Caenorhabditis auriculariae]